MDENLEQLEAELRRLRPMSPTPALRTALAARMASRGRRVTLRLIAWTLPIAAAVALIWTLALPRQGAPESSQRSEREDTRVGTAAAFQPVATENLLLSAYDEGHVTLPDGTDGRRLREFYVDTIVWTNPATNASLRWTVPREEVRVEPIAYY